MCFSMLHERLDVLAKDVYSFGGRSCGDCRIPSGSVSGDLGSKKLGDERQYTNPNRNPKALRRGRN